MDSPLFARLRQRALFFSRAVFSPRHLGSITPSSRYLVRTLLSLRDLSEVHTVVELGPGTGPFTEGLLARLAPYARLLAIERDPQLAHLLRERLPDSRLTVITGDAQEMEAYLHKLGFDSRVPLIVSGLPFTSLPRPVADSILQSMRDTLTPDGVVLLYQYSTFMRSRLASYFGHIDIRWEPRNIPPAVCMRCSV